MAYTQIERNHAENLYVIEGKSINEIGNIMKIPIKTLYAWRKKDEWDLTIKTSSATGLALELSKSMSNELKKAMAEGTLSDPKTADALSKIAKIVEKIQPERTMLSNIYIMLDDVTKIIHHLNAPELMALWLKHIREISDELRKKYASGEVR
ncbi:MAG: hypothetical protein WDA18_09265 [Candidatus Ratteibacteria bacterium]